MHVTQKEIADSLGVSRQLVTYALSGNGTVSDQKRREILQAAERMGYRRNELARAMVTGKSRILGILTNPEINESMARVLAGALEEAADHGYSTKLMFLPFDADEAQAQNVVQRCSTWRLDGVLVVGMSDRHLEILRDEMAQGNRPVAFASHMPPDRAIGAFTDDASAWRIAVKYLIDLGHRRIAHLGARPTARLANSRNEICLQVLREFGLPVDEHSATLTSWGDPELIEQGVHRLLDAPQRPTALLCSGDALAMVALRVARRRGLCVPHQLSIVGFGNNDDSKFTDPALTSIFQPHEMVARHAVRQLLAYVESEENIPLPDEPFRLTTGFKLIVRDSTAPPASI
ncbi:HTH-type transcriptional repressor CytR [Abditibacteriota bacterium]|nr:HTH-type transcriptional repressor CytR [Abditibacteriota bacterium]